MEKFVMVLWMVWWRRNTKCWDDELPSAFEVTGRAKEALEDWVQFSVQTEVTTQISDHNLVQKWTKPQQGTVKCSIDAACFVEYNIYCIGACIHGVEGNFVQHLQQISKVCQRSKKPKLEV